MLYQISSSLVTEYSAAVHAGMSLSAVSPSDQGITGLFSHWVQENADFVVATPGVMLTIWTDYDAALFNFLRDRWIEERKSTSSTSRIVMCSSYQKIIGMGSLAIPLILRELAENIDQWFWALSMITRDDPVPPEIYGKHVAMARAWIAWGRERGVFIGGPRHTSQTYHLETVH